MNKRLMQGAEALAALGELDGELAELAQDLRNAAPSESSEAAAERKARIDECERLGAELAEARREEANAELHAQLGR